MVLSKLKRSFGQILILAGIFTEGIISMNITHSSQDECDLQLLSNRFGPNCNRRAPYPSILKCESWEPCILSLNNETSVSESKERGITTILITNGSTNSNDIATTPLFSIIGVQKGGTTDLRHRLLQHPELAGSSVEIHFFDRYFDPAFERKKQLDDNALPDLHSSILALTVYSDRLLHGNKFSKSDVSNILHVSRGNSFVFDTTPSYMLVPRTPERMASLLPNINIVIVVRDPVERYLSEVHMVMCRNSSTRNFRRYFHLPGSASKFINDFKSIYDTSSYLCMGLAPSKTSCEYGVFRGDSLARGIYVDAVRRWLQFYPAEQIVIIDSKRYYEHQNLVLNEVIASVGLRQFDFKEDSNYLSPGANCPSKKQLLFDQYVNASEIAGDLNILREFYEPYNKEFFNLIQQDLGWNDII